MIYIDDVLVIGANRLECEAFTALTLDVLAKSGWVVSPSKAAGPSSRLTFLGLDICGETLKFFIPEKKLEALIKLCNEAI